MLFFIPHWKEDFLVLEMPYSFVAKDRNPGFDGQLKVVERCASIMKDPLASLRADASWNRLPAATILVA